MRIDDNKEALAMMNRALGSLENKFREAYNKGYADGVKSMLSERPTNKESPNDCKYLKKSSGDVWECGCFLEIYCEHQIYDRYPDGTLNIVRCNYEPHDKDINVRSKEPQTCDTCKYGEDKHKYAHICNECGVGINNYKPKDEPQTDGYMTAEQTEDYKKMLDKAPKKCYGNVFEDEPQMERSSE